MAKSPVFALTPAAALGLFFIQRYRFLTIVQFARASDLSRHRAEDLLRALELRGVLGHFGHVLIPGHGKTPKAYYLKRKGLGASAPGERHSRRVPGFLCRDANLWPAIAFFFT